MTTITGHDLIGVFADLADAVEADKDRLCALDGVIGDADHGLTMALGFAAVGQALAALPGDTVEPAAVFNTAARSFLSAVGASSGPLYATALLRAGASAKGHPTLDTSTFVTAVAAMARGIQERGKAELGDKTMLDAWLPAAQAMEAAAGEGRSLRDCVAAAVTAAEAGAEATKAMVARKGRAARLGDRALGHMDPGAASAVTLLRALRDTRVVAGA